MGIDFVGGTIRIEGFDKMEKILLALPDKLARGILVKGMSKGAQTFKNKAIQNANRSKKPHWLISKWTKEKTLIQPGNLKKIIRIKQDTKKTRGFALTYEIYVKNKHGWYWRFVEFGTVKMAAQKPLRNAFESETYNAVKETEKFLKEHLLELEK